MLSVLYVVRNEEAMLPRSAASMADVADQIVVVDTGSVDKTVREAQQIRRARVVTYPWCHDFSKARNFGIQHCDNEWILYLDADEILGKHSAATIRQAIASASPRVMGFALHVVDQKEWGEAQAEPTSFFPSPQVRVFRKRPDIAFEGRAQESVRPSIERIGGAIDVLAADVQHFLWRGKGEEHARLKLAYYKKLGSILPGLPDAQPGADPEKEAPKAARCAVVVVAHNALNLTKACLSALSKNVSIPTKLVLVNNGSTDGTSEHMWSVLGGPPIGLPRNEGVAKARNLGASAAMGEQGVELVCFLDNDAVVAEGCLEAMMALLDANPSVAAVGPVSNNAPGPQGVASQYKDMDLPAVLKAMPSREPKVVKVESLSGFCLMVRASALKSVGLFDESFGPYGCEDADLCKRLRAAGHELAVANAAYAAHRGRGTLVEARNVDWATVAATAAARFEAKWRPPPPAVPQAAKAPPPQPIGSVLAGLAVARGQRMLPRASIVILTCNRLDMTQPCIESILAHTRNFELIVVDNGSTDGTPDWLAGKPAVKLVRNPTNVGIPKARNQGIKLASAPYVVVMDNDIEVKEGWLQDLFDAMARDRADVSGIEAWQVNSDFAASKKCVSRGERVDYLGGACNLFKRRVFEEAGLLDEGFSPAYYEDVDLCIRATRLGMRLAWEPTKKIVHKEHATLVHGGQRNFSYTGALAQSHQRFAAKMRGQLKVEHELLPKLPASLRILYLGMEHDYGVRERGNSYEHDNFWPALAGYPRASSIFHFDFAEQGQRMGLARMSEALYEAVQRECPDVLFAVFFNDQTDPRKEMLKKISQTTPCKTIGWFCDSHWRYESFDRPWANFLDFNVTTSESAYARYVRDGLGAKVIKSQWAVSPKYKKIPGTQLDVDVSFVGQPHGDRRQVIAAIRDAGINVQVFGTGWKTRLSFDEMVMMFNRSKINLNLNNASDARFKQIKGRNFEVPGCGGFLLTEAAENLGDYFTLDKEMGIYGSTGDLIEKIKYYLANPGLAQAMAEAGYRRCMADHLYGNRLDAIFSRAGLI